MGLIRRVGKLSVRAVLKVSGLFIKAMKSKEAHHLVTDLAEIDRKVREKYINTTEAKKEFSHLMLKLEHALIRLKQKGEQFEAQHLYHVYERFAEGLEDQKILKHLKNLHP